MHNKNKLNGTVTPIPRISKDLQEQVALTNQSIEFVAENYTTWFLIFASNCQSIGIPIEDVIKYITLNLKPAEFGIDEIERIINVAYKTQINEQGQQTKSKNARRVKRSPENIMEEVEKRIKELKSKDIADIQPIIILNGIPLIYPNTLTLIQGKAGSHKSRAAGAIASAIIKAHDCEVSPLGLSTSSDDLCVLYIDTERNLNQQFPKAIQDIQASACIDKKDDPPNLGYSSLLEIDRLARFEALKTFVEKKRDELGQEKHIILILDVVSDMIGNFNDPVESMKLTDYLNLLINSENITIIAVLHENPGANTDKARGHLGTELNNKSSTTIQVSLYKEDIVKLTVKKSRNTKLPEPVYAEYCEKIKGLVLIEPTGIPATQTITGKADLQSVAKYLGEHLQVPMLRSKIIEAMTVHFGCSERTIEDRIKKIVDQKILILGTGGGMELVKENRSDGLYFSLKELEVQCSDEEIEEE